ncbi:hypothetical protein AB0L00_32400 [Actinoallomurus sp. NPDC052308]
MAAPVTDDRGTVVGAVAASAPAPYFGAHRDRMIEAVRQGADLLGPC